MKSLQLKFIFFSFFLMISCAVSAQDLANLKNEKPISLSGGLNVQTGFYGINGVAARQPGFTYLIYGAPTLRFYGIDMPFSFTYSNFQRDFRQPFNQLGISPNYKWITLHAGFRNISYSQFAMAGVTILGGGIELNPKKFRFAILHGRAQKAVAEDTSKIIINTLNGIHYPAYKRTITTGRIGIGTQTNFIDLSVLVGSDDSSSLASRPINSQIAPSRNQVVGINFNRTFLKQKLVWRGEAALSSFTRDIAFESIDFGNKFINDFLKPNATTQIYSALETQLNYSTSKYGFGAKYRKVAPDFQSMGAYFFQTDFEQILGNLRFNLWKSKLRVSASGGTQKDNLSNKKLATTSRRIYNAAVSFNPNMKFGVDATFANFGTSQRPGTRSLSDTALINQINYSFNVSPRYTMVDNAGVKSIQAIFGQQILDDRNTFTQEFTQVQMMFLNLLFMRSLTQKELSYNAGLNYSNSKNIAGTIGLYGIMGGFSKVSKSKKINHDISSSLNASTFESNYNGYIASFQYNFGLVLSKKQKLVLSANAVINQSNNEAAGNSFQEYFLRINYGFNL